MKENAQHGCAITSMERKTEALSLKKEALEIVLRRNEHDDETEGVKQLEG